MTGFGAASLEKGGLSIRVELRSVNHRHLQIKSRLPAEFLHIEHEVEALLRKRIERGSLTAFVSVKRATQPEDLRVEVELAARYRELLSRMAKATKLPDDLRLVELASLPGVISGRSVEAPSEAESKLLLKTLAAACGELIAMRSAEGANMAADIALHGERITKVLNEIRKRLPKVVREHHEALKKRVEDLLGPDSCAPSPDLARELALLADRLDVSEEVARLESHLGQLGKMLAKGGSTGRRLDFLAQEFFREANTIGSKCSDAKVAHLVVELKMHIERLREQVQNVE